MIGLVAASFSLFMLVGSAAIPDEGTAKEEKKICRGIVATGSVIPKKFCLTRSEWTEFNRRNQDDAESALRKRLNNNRPDSPT